MNTEEIAAELYRVWATKMDILSPTDDVAEYDTWNQRVKEMPTGRFKPRPNWHSLDSVQQGVWLAVAETVKSGHFYGAPAVARRMQ